MAGLCFSAGIAGGAPPPPGRRSPASTGPAEPDRACGAAAAEVPG